MKRIEFLKKIRSWTKGRGHRWRSRKKGSGRSVLCNTCSVSVTETGEITGNPWAPGRRPPGADMRTWIQENVPHCSSMERAVMDVMLD